VIYHAHIDVQIIIAITDATVTNNDIPNASMKLVIDDTQIDICMTTSPSANYNSVAGVCHTPLLNSYRFTVGSGNVPYTFINTPRGSFMVNDDNIGRGLSSNSNMRGISTLIKPIRFEESLDIYSHTNTSDGNYILQYAYLLD